jgi:GNAT superfamily N-acetyltransferase
MNTSIAKISIFSTLILSIISSSTTHTLENFSQKFLSHNASDNESHQPFENAQQKGIIFKYLKNITSLENGFYIQPFASTSSLEKEQIKKLMEQATSRNIFLLPSIVDYLLKEQNGLILFNNENNPIGFATYGSLAKYSLEKPKELNKFKQTKSSSIPLQKTYTVGELQYLFIQKSSRGKHYGETLFDYAIQELTHKAKCDLIKITVSDNNERAKKLYTKKGFQTFSTYNRSELKIGLVNVDDHKENPLEYWHDL